MTVAAHSLTSFTFPDETEIDLIERRGEGTLKIYVSDLKKQSGRCVTFHFAISVRIADERDLMEYWPVCSTPAGWLFRVLDGGWLAQELNRPGSISPKIDPDIKEYLITGIHDCVSVLSIEEPVLSEYHPYRRV
ncbi:hypothetical protein [Herbaspirillum rhizosphaerae]|uniref:hypothetical protein n=1 Tax=Herbaspirillum rhizosphaerae TaxID=346179 RepID=UPI0012EE1951|nr:hypothetical protein [Herbaspirillum rhizosphaerae]